MYNIDGNGNTHQQQLKIIVDRLRTYVDLSKYNLIYNNANETSENVFCVTVIYRNDNSAQVRVNATFLQLDHETLILKWSAILL
jgi:hypothetical protein